MEKALIITIITSVLASGGLWSVIRVVLEKRADKKDGKTKLLLGLAHDKICFLSEKYLERGYISTEEYQNLIDYLYTPYKSLGGNGAAERLVQEVGKLNLGCTLNKGVKNG